MSIIEFDDASVSYKTQTGGERALDGVDLEIEESSFVGVTGPSEAGKSTLLRTIASYVPNYFSCDLEGSVTVEGTSVAEVSIGEMSAMVGMLFENPFDQLTGATTTVVEEVAYGLENQGLPRDEIMERTYESLEKVGIVDLMNRNPYDLSGGQSQRVALASILALQPDILLLDEPTSQLDPSGTEEVFDVVEEMATGEYTVVVVSQDVERLAPVVDRLLVLDDGRIARDGTPGDVLSAESAGDGRIFIPDVVRVGQRLRRSGLIDGDRPVPLQREDLVAELRKLVADGDRPAPATNGDGAPPTGDGATVAFEDVSYTYEGDIEALSDVSLSIGPGCTCLIGQNGAGKSTFAKHLNGLLEPTEGRVLVGGKDTREYRVAQLARDVGLSFQNPDNQLFHSSVAKEIRYGPTNLGYDEDRIDELVDRALDVMDLHDVRSKNPYDLGHARRKRAAVASVLAMDTDVVVLDEPTGGQDVEGVELLGQAIDELIAAGTTVIVITHDMSFARDYADRVIALRQGEVILDGDPRTVFGRPDELSRTHVEPPTVTRIVQELGLDGTVLTIDELFDVVAAP